jgi:hypothetical protein
MTVPALDPNELNPERAQSRTSSIPNDQPTPPAFDGAAADTAVGADVGGIAVEETVPQTQRM